MISALQLAIDHYEAGHTAAAQQVLDGMTPGARFQIDVNFDAVRRICQHRRGGEYRARRANALNVEVGAYSQDRCMRQSPDGRGAIWLLSGGALEAYGVCCRQGCPLATNAPTDN